MMEYYRQEHIKPVHLAEVASGRAVQEAFRYMQQGSHIGKIVISLHGDDANPTLGMVINGQSYSPTLDPSAPYLVVGGLGGLDRSVSVWLVEHGARNLTFLSRSAGSGPHDKAFVRKIENMGCKVRLIRGSVTEAMDVERAVAETVALLKRVIQMSMVLRDQMFPYMSMDDWNSAIGPKMQGTWNLHNSTLQIEVKLDFFVLFSSLSGIMGQPGQANYAAVNTFLHDVLQYRQNAGFPCNAIDISAMEGTGYLFYNADLLREMQGTGWSTVVEEELFEALAAATQSRQIVRNSIFALTYLLTRTTCCSASPQPSSSAVRLAALVYVPMCARLYTTAITVEAHPAAPMNV